MNNTEKLIASQYLVKQAIFGLGIFGTSPRVLRFRLASRLASGLASGLGKHFGGMGRFIKQTPMRAAAVVGGGGLGGLAIMDTVSAMAGNEPTNFKFVKHNPVVKGFREISNKNPFMADLMVAGNPLIGPSYFAKKISGKPDASKSEMIGGAGKYDPSESPFLGKPDPYQSRLFGEAGIYRGPQDFKPGLRAPTPY